MSAPYPRLQRLDPDFKLKWIQALLSGEFKQITGTMKGYLPGTQQEAYCCLGVAAEICRRENLLNHPTVWVDGSLYFNSEGEDGDEAIAAGSLWCKPMLPAVGLEWLTGVKGYHPRSIMLWWNGAYHEASSLNDNFGLSFREIADLVAEQL